MQFGDFVQGMCANRKFSFFFLKMNIFSKLIPLWLPLFNSYQGQLSGNIRVRLQNIVSWPCPPQTRDDAMMISTILIRWLQRIQAKMSQIEMQSSTAIQFYCI